MLLISPERTERHGEMLCLILIPQVGWKNFEKPLDFCTYICYNLCTGESEVKIMSPRTGRPTANKKTERLEIRLTPQEAEKLQYCADKMSVSKTDVINRGIDLVQAELDKK